MGPPTPVNGRHHLSPGSTCQRRLQLLCQSRVPGTGQGERGASLAGAPGAPHAVHVRPHSRRRVHVHHCAHPFEVDAPGPSRNWVKSGRRRGVPCIDRVWRR